MKFIVRMSDITVTLRLSISEGLDEDWVPLIRPFKTETTDKTS